MYIFITLLYYGYIIISIIQIICKYFKKCRPREGTTQWVQVLKSAMQCRGCRFSPWLGELVSHMTQTFWHKPQAASLSPQWNILHPSMNLPHATTKTWCNQRTLGTAHNTQINLLKWKYSCIFVCCDLFFSNLFCFLIFYISIFSFIFKHLNNFHNISILKVI